MAFLSAVIGESTRLGGSGTAGSSFSGIEEYYTLFVCGCVGVCVGFGRGRGRIVLDRKMLVKSRELLCWDLRVGPNDERLIAVGGNAAIGFNRIRLDDFLVLGVDHTTVLSAQNIYPAKIRVLHRREI